ncbi:MAG TPA: hypothetical protein VI875_01620 [Candidatus Norongarragalinales archaeon]|nr:hypothetical protein [Candidatus Norongarragalinales archaeon]
MVSKLKNGFWLVSLILLSAAALSSAFTAEEEAAFFAREGEVSSSAEFNGYQMVLINGIETAVLKKSDAGFEIVQDSPGIDSAVDKYSAKAFEDLKGVSAQAVAELNSTRGPIDRCIIGSKWFSYNLTRGGVYVKFNVRYDRFHFPKEWGAIWFVQNNSGNFERNWTIAKQAIDSLLQSPSQEQAFENAKNAREGLEFVKLQYPKFYQAYLNASSSNQFAYRYRGEDDSCAPTANVTPKIDAVLALIGANKFNSPSLLKETVKTRTKERAAEAAQNRLKTGASETAGDLASQADALAQNYSVYGIDLKKLKIETENLRNAIGKPEFENQSKTLEQKLARYKTSFTQYLNARDLIGQADAALQNASQRYGPLDSRVSDLNAQLQSVKISLRENENSLVAGNLDAVDMAGVGQNATIVTSSAQGLQARENEIDFVTIGVVILVLLGIAGGAYYLYKRRQNPPLGGTSAQKVSLKDIEEI